MSETEDPAEFLKEANVAILATVDAKGRAHAAPIWYLYEDGEIIMSTGERSQKLRNIQRNPDVTLVVDRRTLPYYAVMAQGTAEIGPPVTPEVRRRLATRYLGDERAERYLSSTSAEGSLTVRLRPRKLIEFNGRAGR